ncbi:hypothetical protein [Motiliproteus sp.]|uniref:hypothetical protein n=1 Tax=Motiliproteus sp. TaxID=1898955 RepID=UPI003BA9943D
MDSNNYFVSSINYLDRAQDVFDKEDVTTWFYSALEIRFGVEARMREYLEFHKQASEKMKKQYKPAVLDKHIASIFRKGNNEEAIFTINPGSSESIKLKYTPVTKELIDIVKNLGAYLHAPRDKFIGSDNFWSNLEFYITRGIELLKYANSGELLGIPLINRETNQIEIFSCINKDLKDKIILQGAEEIIIHVEYKNID